MAPIKQPEVDLKAVFTDLAITPSDEPLPEISRSRESLPNPFTGALQASAQHGTPYSLYVPLAAVPRAVFLINAAARKENLGVRIVVNNKRDAKGALVKGADGKAQPIVEAKGENKGKVLVRFQGSPERKQSAPRPFSIVTDPDNANGKALKERATGALVARGTHDEMRAELKRRKEAAKNAQQSAA